MKTFWIWKNKKKLLSASMIFMVFFLFPIFIFLFSCFIFFFGNIEISYRMNTFLMEIFPYNQYLQLKQSDYFYKKWDYHTALLHYSAINCSSERICFFVWHNLGNTFYKFWELQEEKSVKINFWKKSLESYQDALDIKYDSETQENYYFVREKLEELLKEEEKEENLQEEENEWQEDEINPEQNPQEESNNSTEISDIEEQQQESSPWEENENTSPQWYQNPNFWLWWEQEEWFQPLSEEERKSIQEYLQQLQVEEKRNSELNKPWNRFENFQRNTEW